MTSFAFIFGVVPLVVASGAGAEMRRSLGTAVFSGMLGVTLFGIFLTPVFFYVIQGRRASRGSSHGRPRPSRWVGSRLALAGSAGGLGIVGCLALGRSCAGVVLRRAGGRRSVAAPGDARCGRAIAAPAIATDRSNGGSTP